MVLDRVYVLFSAVLLVTVALSGASSVITTGISHGAPRQAHLDTFCSNGPFSLNTSLNRASQTINILQLNTGSTGSICLDYQFQNGAPAVFRPSIEISKTNSSDGTFIAVACESTNGSEVFRCPGIHLSYEVAELLPSPGPHTVGVNITVDSTAKQGVYWLWLGVPCSPTVLYVGQPPSRLSLEEAGGVISCIALLNAPSVRIAGILGFNVVSMQVSSSL
jgi:hypothetical protein